MIARLILAAILAALASASEAAVLCQDRESLVARMQRVHGEVRHSAGLASPGRLVETFVNPDTGSWTMVLTEANGISCLLAAGTAFQYAPPPDPGAPT